MFCKCGYVSADMQIGTSAELASLNHYPCTWIGCGRSSEVVSVRKFGICHTYACTQKSNVRASGGFSILGSPHTKSPWGPRAISFKGPASLTQATVARAVLSFSPSIGSSGCFESCLRYFCGVPASRAQPMYMNSKTVHARVHIFHSKSVGDMLLHGRAKLLLSCSCSCESTLTPSPLTPSTAPCSDVEETAGSLNKTGIKLTPATGQWIQAAALGNTT